MMEVERIHVTKNNVKIYSYKNPALHSFHISLFVRAGSMYEEEKYYGVTHFFEHIAIRNVNKLYGMKLYSELDRRGMEFNAGTYSEMIQFYISGADLNFSFGAEVISGILKPIVLCKEEIDAERKRIKAEIRESDERTSLASFTSKIVFADTSLATSVIGTNKGIDRISLKVLEAYRKEILAHENIFFYVTGNFEGSDILSLAEKIESLDLISGKERDNTAPVPTVFGNRPEEIYVKNADFGMVRFTFDLDMTKYSVAETDLIYDILLSGYNSKLFVEMSEKRGLFYDISGATERYKNIGTFYFSFEVQEKNIPEAIGIVVDILDSMKTVALTEEECMKAGYVDNAYLLYDDSRELNFTFSYDNHMMNEKYASIEDRKNRYKDITPERISEMARDIFRRKNLTLTMKAESKNIDKEKINSILRRLG